MALAIKQKNGYQQILEKAEASRASLEAQVQQSADRATAIQEQLDQAAARTRDLAQQLAAARANVERMQGAAEHARRYATLAEGTLQETQAVQSLAELEEQFHLAESALLSLDEQATDEMARNATKTAILEPELSQIQMELADLRKQLQAVEQVRHQAVAALGAQEYREAILSIEQRKQQLAAARLAVASARRDLEHARAEAREALAYWPIYQRQVDALFALDDPATRVLSAALAYLESLLQDGNQVGAALDAISNGSFTGYSVFELLFIPYEAASGSVVLLQEQRDKIAQLLEQYRAKKRG